MIRQKHGPIGAVLIFPIYFCRNFEDQTEKKNEALLDIYGIATPFYRTIMSLLNIKIMQNFKAVKLVETSIVSMQICLLGKRYRTIIFTSEDCCVT